MTEKDLKVFIDVTMNYFQKTFPGDPATMEEPYLRFDEPLLLDYSGVIHIRGKTEGYVYLTTPRDMLAHLLHAIGETDINDVYMRDFVGEMATTIAGNVRRVFGASFQLSPPFAMGGDQQDRPEFPFAMFVVPITWKNYQSYLVIGVMEDE